MSSPKVDVIVLGLGSMGAAACYHLARRGFRVLGLEQHAIPHGLGAHHGYSRMIRLAYYEDPGYVPLLRRAYELWRDLETEFGSKILHVTGGLYMGREGESFLTGALRAALEHSLPHALFSHAEIKRRYPQFHLPSDYEGFWEDEAGFLIPELAMAAHVQGALLAGAELHGHEAARAWSAGADGVNVETSKASYRAERLVIAAGAWTAPILADLGLPLVVTRQAWGWFWPKDPAAFRLGTLPCWFIETEPGHGYYGPPIMSDNPGLKVALHKPTEPTSPEVVDRAPREEDEALLRPFLARHIPSAEGPLLGLRTCLYTNSPDGHFIVDQHPIHDRVSFACGFSGHGFKFASVMGEVLADMATGSLSSLPMDFLRLARFTSAPMDSSS